MDKKTYQEENVYQKDSKEMVNEMIVEGYNDCGSSTSIYECKDDCIIVGGPLISKIH